MEDKKSKMPKWLFVFLIVVSLLFLVSFAGAFFIAVNFAGGAKYSLDEGYVSDDGFGGGLFPSAEDRDLVDSPEAGGGAVGEDLVPGEAPAPTDEETRKIIKAGTIYSVVENLDNAGEKAKAIVEKYEGYVIGYTKYDESVAEMESLSITVRVPAKDFEKLIAEFEEIGRVTYQSTTGDDVTDEYVDLRSRLKNLEVAEAQFVEIMEKATKVEDILAVQRELTNVRSEIEVIKGRMQYLDKSAELSTVRIDFTLEERSKDVISDQWDPQGTIRNALRALVVTLQTFADGLIYLVILSPLVLVPAGIAYMIYKRAKRNTDGKAK